MLVEAIQSKFNYLRDDIVSKINRINSTEVIRSLLRAIFQIETLDDFDKLIDKAPERVIETAVKGMLPKNPLGRAMYTKMKVYAGSEHPHTAQQPKTLEV